MIRLRIRLFGQISVQRGGESVPALSSKALELLCYLLLHRDRGHTREALAGLFWPDAPDSLSKKYLRQAIWRLHSTLSRKADQESEELFIVRPGWIRVNPEASWWLDVATFEQAYDTYRDIPGKELTDQQAQDIRSAAILYRGDLIEAWYQDWCIYERDRLQLIYLTMLEQLMSYFEACGRYANGIGYGHCILRHDPARESTYRQLMRLYYQSGDRTTALRHYERCAAAMAKHFNLQPSRETTALYHQIRGDRLERPARLTAITTRPDGEIGNDLILGLQARLDHIQASLTALQRQVQQELAPVSQLLTGRQETLDQRSR
jgi:DNA-binding SARP family transcriptional activator